MSRKHCTKHPERGTSNYAGGSGRMGEGEAMLRDLRKTQNARERQTGSPWPEPNSNDEARLKFIRSFRPVPESLGGPRKRAA